MSAVVQTRLDPETQTILERIVNESGLTRSDVLREGIKLVAEKKLSHRKHGLIGAGMFDTGIPDLATNKKYLEDFGKTRRPIRVAK
jgi:hypothetical protein